MSLLRLGRDALFLVAVLVLAIPLAAVTLLYESLLWLASLGSSSRR